MYSWKRLFIADQNNPLSQEVGSSISEDELPDAELEDLSVDPKTIRVGKELSPSALPQNIKEILREHLSSLEKLESKIKCTNGNKLVLTECLLKELEMIENEKIDEVESIEPVPVSFTYYTSFKGWQDYFFAPPVVANDDKDDTQHKQSTPSLPFEEKAKRALSFLPLIEMIFISVFTQDLIENQGEKMTAANETLSTFRNLIVNQIDRFGFDANILMPEALEIIADYVKKMPDQSNLMTLWLLLANHYAQNDRLLMLLPILIVRLEEGQEEVAKAYNDMFTKGEFSVPIADIELQAMRTSKYSGVKNYERIKKHLDEWLHQDAFQSQVSMHW